MKTSAPPNWRELRKGGHAPKNSVAEATEYRSLAWLDLWGEIVTSEQMVAAYEQIRRCEDHGRSRTDAVECARQAIALVAVRGVLD